MTIPQQLRADDLCHSSERKSYAEGAGPLSGPAQFKNKPYIQIRALVLIRINIAQVVGPLGCHPADPCSNLAKCIKQIFEHAIPFDLWGAHVAASGLATWRSVIGHKQNILQNILWNIPRNILRIFCGIFFF